MTTWYTSDLHFGHKNIIKYNPEFRQYESILEMEEGIIEVWNKFVKAKDTIFILGDFSFYRAERTVEILDRLNGKKILIKGNHDSHLVKKKAFLDKFEAVHDYLEIRIENDNMVLFHFPIQSWHRIHHGAVHLHGHCHGAKTGIPGKIRDVGWDVWGYPVSHSEIIKCVNSSPIIGHGGYFYKD